MRAISGITLQLDLQYETSEVQVVTPVPAPAVTITEKTTLLLVMVTPELRSYIVNKTFNDHPGKHCSDAEIEQKDVVYKVL